MAKSKRTRGQQQSKALTKKQIARSQKITRQQRVIWLAVAGVAAVVLIVLTIGIVQEYVLGPRQPVATVNGREISREEYQKRVRYTQWYLQRVEQSLLLQQASYDPNDESQQFLYQYIGSQIEQVQQQRFSAPAQALEDLIEEALAGQETERRGLAVSSEELQLSIEQQFGYDRNPPEPTPTPITTTETLTLPTPIAPMTKGEFDEAYNEYIRAVSAIQGFSEEDFYKVVEQALLREKLGEALAAEVPTTDEHVHAYHILVEDEETAAEVLEKLDAGADFADLVAEYSQDEDTADKGGELGWLARGQRGVSVTLVDAAFALQPDEISEAIETYEGYHIATIDERQVDYPLDEGTLEWRKTQAFDDWLAEAKQTADIQRIGSTEDIPTG
jgi:hypothetical protein